MVLLWFRTIGKYSSIVLEPEIQDQAVRESIKLQKILPSFFKFHEVLVALRVPYFIAISLHLYLGPYVTSPMSHHVFFLSVPVWLSPFPYEPQVIMTPKDLAITSS